MLPPLPLPPCREDPHHEERDEDDQEEPGTVTVIERDIRLLGRATGADVGPHLRPLDGCSPVRAQWSDHRPQARSGSSQRRRIWARSARPRGVVEGLSGQGTNGPMDHRMRSPESLEGPFRRTTVVRL